MNDDTELLFKELKAEKQDEAIQPDDADQEQLLRGAKRFADDRNVLRQWAADGIEEEEDGIKIQNPVREIAEWNREANEWDQAVQRLFARMDAYHKRKFKEWEKGDEQ